MTVVSCRSKRWLVLQLLLSGVLLAYTCGFFCHFDSILKNHNKVTFNKPSKRKCSVLYSKKFKIGMNEIQQSRSEFPQHVAFILDGNGRWAEKRGLPRTAGHVEGAKRAQEIVMACRKLGIPYVTLYALSTENWGRPVAEIDQILELMEQMVRKNAEEFGQQGIFLRVIGQRHRLPQSFNDLVQDLEEKEKQLRPEEQAQNTMKVCLAVSYGGRDDIVSAAKELVKMSQSGSLDADLVDEDFFHRYVSTSKIGIPDPDVIIRTSGETRLSNFFLWQAAYSEIQIVDKLWPDFEEKDLKLCIEAFLRKDRRYGLVI